MTLAAYSALQNGERALVAARDAMRAAGLPARQLDASLAVVRAAIGALTRTSEVEVIPAPATPGLHFTKAPGPGGTTQVTGSALVATQTLIDDYALARMQDSGALDHVVAKMIADVQVVLADDFGMREQLRTAYRRGWRDRGFGQSVTLNPTTPYDERGSSVG